MKPVRILLAVDGSEQALEAVRYVGGFLSGGDLKITLLHILTKVPESFWNLEGERTYNYRIVDIRAWELQQQKAVEDFMDRAREILLDSGIPDRCITVSMQVRKSGIVDDIAAETQRGYDAVIVGRRGLSDLKDLVLGSTSYKLLERLHQTPLWVVGGSPRPGKALLCLDHSEAALRTVDYLSRLVPVCPSMEVTLIHAIQSLSFFRQLLGVPFSQEHERELAEAMEKEGAGPEEDLNRLFEQARRRLVEVGLPADRVRQKILKAVTSRAAAVIEEAVKEGTDTIIVGRRGLSKVQGFFMGRMSNKLIQLAREQAVWVVS